MTLYAGSKKVCPTIAFLICWLNLDGGKADSKYVYAQSIDGGNAFIGGTIKTKINGGKAQWQL